MAEKEIRKDIEGYEGSYQISNLGRVKSLERYTRHGKRVRERILKQQPNKDGYLSITIGRKERKRTFLVHRLVATYFIKNPLHLPEVNHKDVNVINNRADNLEWCDRMYNVHYDDATLKVAEKMKKPVIQMDLEGNFIKQWESIKEAAEALNTQATRITACCKGKKYRHTVAGFKWKYAEKSE